MTETNGKAASDLVKKQYDKYRKDKDLRTFKEQYLGNELEKNPQLHKIVSLLNNLLKDKFYGDLGVKIKDGEIIHVTKAESIKL